MVLSSNLTNTLHEQDYFLYQKIYWNLNKKNFLSKIDFLQNSSKIKYKKPGQFEPRPSGRAYQFGTFVFISCFSVRFSLIFSLFQKNKNSSLSGLTTHRKNELLTWPVRAPKNHFKWEKNLQRYRLQRYRRIMMFYLSAVENI